MKKGSELKRFTQHLKAVDYLIYPLSEHDREELIALASSVGLYAFERPDIILKGAHKTILLEHFRVTALENANTQSYDTYEDISELLDTNAYDGSYITTRAFMENVVHLFNTHARKADTYLTRYYKHTTNKDSTPELGMIIENTHTPLYISHLHNGKSVLLPFQSTKFIKALETYSDFKHIFYVFKQSRNKYAILYFHNTKHARSVLLSEKSSIGVFPQTDPVFINIFSL